MSTSQLIVAVAVAFSGLYGGGCRRRSEATAEPTAKSTAAAPVVPPARPLKQVLEEEIGRGTSIAILASDDGVLAASVDGKRQRTLVSGHAAGIFVDNRSDALWYRMTTSTSLKDGKENCYVLDLRAPEARPLLVISGVDYMNDPDVAYEHPYETVPPAANGSILLLKASGPILQRRIDTCGGRERDGCPKYKRVACAQGRPETKCLTIDPGAVPLLTNLAERGVGHSLFLTAHHRRVRQHVETEDAECPPCGTATRVPGTSYWSVLTQVLGDFCHVSAELYDPKTKEFIDAQSGMRAPHPYQDVDTTFDGVWTARNGDAFIRGDQLRTFTAGRLQWSAHYRAGGFLGGAWWLPNVDISCGDDPAAEEEEDSPE